MGIPEMTKRPKGEPEGEVVAFLIWNSHFLYGQVVFSFRILA